MKLFRHMTFWVWSVLLLLPAVSTASAQAETIRILALGASNTNGKGLMSSADAWPAQLEKMLRAKGYDVSISVNAVDGQTSGQILDRGQSAIAPGTKVVVYDSGGDNDRLKGFSPSQTHANVAQIAAMIRAHGAVPIRADYIRVVGPQHSNSPNYQPDGIHLTAASHARVAASLMPQVIAAIGRQK
jgi:acyl-CoA thioesterase-1